MSSLDTNNFFQECAFITANDCRLLPPAWCPTRDVLVLVSRVDQKDKLELWKMQGAKLWEVDVAKGAKTDEITAICWSADGTLSYPISRSILSFRLIICTLVQVGR
jgi:anaphase-promoting complex subunit 4